jgi:hypothetical protein
MSHLCGKQSKHPEGEGRDGRSRSRITARTERKSLRGSLIKKDQKFEEKVSLSSLASADMTLGMIE